MKQSTILFTFIMFIQTNIYCMQKPHINLPEGFFGITALFAFDSETAQPLRQLAEIALRRESTLSIGEREMIAGYVSKKNECNFCRDSHCSAAQHLLDKKTVDAVLENPATAPASDKFKALLVIAGKVQESGLNVTDEHITQAKNCGASEKEIQETVLIASMFCMFNRYVDGLRTPTPDGELYKKMGERMAKEGYIRKNSTQQ